MLRRELKTIMQQAGTISVDKITRSFSRQDYPQLHCAAPLVMKRQALCLSGRMPDFRSPYLYLWWLDPHPQACTCAR